MLCALQVAVQSTSGKRLVLRRDRHDGPVEVSSRVLRVLAQCQAAQRLETFRPFASSAAAGLQQFARQVVRPVTAMDASDQASLLVVLRSDKDVAVRVRNHSCQLVRQPRALVVLASAYCLQGVHPLEAGSATP